jgi:hypothetical protein
LRSEDRERGRRLAKQPATEIKADDESEGADKHIEEIRGGKIEVNIQRGL